MDKYYTIIENVEYSHETLFIDVLKIKKYKNTHYSNTNYTLSSLVREVKPMFEEMPEKISYNTAPLDLLK
jgi:hypothetical protein